MPARQSPTRICSAEAILAVLEQILELAAKQFDRQPDTIDADATLEQLGIDSLAFLEYLFELEEHFNVSIPQNDVKQVRTIRQLSALIERELAASSPPSN